MFGQGSYTSQFGRGPPPPLQSPYMQQLPDLPPLPPHFQQGPLAAPPSAFQRGPSVYQHGPPVPHPAVRQIPPDAVVANGSQPILHPQPSVHGSTPFPHIYSTDKRSTHLPSHLGTQNVHRMPPHPPRVLPPPPPPAAMYRAPLQLQSQQPGDAQNLSCMPPPPPPPPSSFTSNPFGNFEQSTGGNSHMPSVAPLPPPPPPFDPPPIPTSPPPPTSPLSSSAHHEAASNLISSRKPYCSEVSALGFVDKDGTTCVVRQNVPQNDGSLSQEGSPSPPKPTEEKLIQKIENLCQCIAKNGSGYEDLVRQNESGNPEFEFLFAGDPGGEAAIAHEYFLWMKKKCILACKLKERSESPLRALGTYSSMESSYLEVASRTYSPADSDMEMEDDITQSGNDPVVNHSIEGKNSGYDFVHNELDVKELSHKQQMPESEKATCATPVLLEQGKVVSHHDQLALERPVSKVCRPMISSLIGNLNKSATISVDDKFQSGASTAAQGLYSEKKSSHLIKGGSSFRLLQDYASDEQHLEYVSPLKGASSGAVGASSPHRNTGLSISPKAASFCEDSGKEAVETVMASVASGTIDGHVHNKHKDHAYSSHAESPQDFQRKDALEVAAVEVCLNGNFHTKYAEEGAKTASNSIKVDEFGRLVREGASDSDSEGSHYNGRQGKRGRSRSRSPLDRRRSRNPRRRRVKRSRSRSWSPRKRRSRSRSPRTRKSRSRSPRRRRNSRSAASRHVGEFSGDGMRRDRGQIAGCFDFHRGRCYRGASCQYLHHDSEKVDGSKRHRSKQHLELPPVPKDSTTHGVIKHNLQKELDQQHDVVKISEMQQGQDMPGSSYIARKDMHYEKIDESINNANQSGNFDQDSRLIDSRTVKSDTFKSHGGASLDILPLENPVTIPALFKLSDPLLQNADCPQQNDKSSISDSFPEQTSRISVNKLPVSEALPTTIDLIHHSAQLPPPPPSFSQGVTALHMTPPPGNYNLISQSASFTYQSASGERFSSYMLSGQQSNFSVPPIPSWTPLPLPPPGVSSQIRPHAAVLPTPSQVGDFQQQSFPPMPEPNQFISHAEDFRLKPLPPYNPHSQQFIRDGLLREDQSTHLPTLGHSTLSSFPQGDNQHVPAPFSRELSASKMQPFPADNLPPGRLLKSSSLMHPHLQQQQPPYGMHHSASVSSSSKFPPDCQDVNQSSHPLDFRGSRISTYNNPHASAFERPLSSKFSSDAFRQEDTTYSSKYASAFIMNHAQVDMRDTGSVGSRQATSSPNSTRAVGQNFPRSGGDQYDPLLDSFEPSSNLSNKTNNVETWEPSSDSDMMLRHSGSNKPVDVEENKKKKKEVGSIAVTTAVYKEECGESADAEVGAVENESPINPTGAANMYAGEIDMDQLKSPSKSKNKESRSMKLFKVALADFVKEVLKPSWRQGNMSKEAFKTIVKKTVDKVSVAMKSHQIPKSRAKIDQYIVSSQRKLTKLVAGYVDKYVKM